MSDSEKLKVNKLNKHKNRDTRSPRDAGNSEASLNVQSRQTAAGTRTTQTGAGGKNILKNLKILIAEDEDDAREALVSVLKRRSGKVLGCADGKEGLEAFEEFLPDLVVADLLMPVMDGIQMVSQMHSRFPDHKFSVVILTAMDDPDTIIKAVDAGIDKYVLKPVNIPDFLNALNEVALKTEKNPGLSALEGENRFIIQDRIKRNFAAYIKQSSGKGPREITINLTPETIEVTAYEIMTTMERSIFVDKANKGVVQYSREIYFSTNADKFCQVIYDAAGIKVTMRESRVDIDNDRVKLIFNIQPAGQ